MQEVIGSNPIIPTIKINFKKYELFFMQSLKKRIIAIEKRNRRVESDKAWEISWTRKILIACITYIIIVLFFYIVKLPMPWINAIVPTAGFILSTLTISIVKKYWIRKH